MTQNTGKQPSTVLDYVDQITVPGDVFKEPTNEYWALVSLSRGLDFLAKQVRRCESDVQSRVNPKGNLKVLSFGNLPEFDGLPMELLTCTFHWYAISACQYVRIVGVIAKSHEPKSPEPIKYVESIIPEVKAFRDKVAAHFAWASYNKKDNDAERMASIFPSVSWSDDHFVVGSDKVAIRKGGQASKSEYLTPWSISVVHQRLCERYWKNSMTATTEEVPSKHSK